MSSRLSYANVMATLAFLVAVAGGSAYAVSQISGKQIRDHSIPVSKLVRGAVVPHAALADNVSHLLVSKSRSRHHGAQLADGSPSAHVADAGSSSLVTLSVGQSAAVIQQDPFTITATCTDEGNGIFRASLQATANVDGWYANFGAQSAGATVTLGEITSSGPSSAGQPGVWFRAPAGQSLVVDAVFSVHQIGDCSFEVYGIS